MKFPSIRDSLSSKISFWVVLVSAFLLTVIMMQLLAGMARYIRAEVEKDAMQILDNTVLRVNGILEDAELAAGNTAWLVERDIDKPDSMVRYSNEAVRNNPVLSSCSIAFEPNFYRSEGLFYSIFSYRNADNVIEWEQEGDEDYDYFTMPWYAQTKKVDRPGWTEPYLDAAANNYPGMDTILVSYCCPVYNKKHQYAGCVSVDISLKWLSRSLLSVKPYPNSYCFMIGKSGSYLVHPDVEKLSLHNFFTEQHSNPDMYDLGNAMLNQETGMREMTMEGKHCYVFFAPLETTGWSVAMVCPEKDIFGGYDNARRLMILNILISLLVLFFVFVWMIRKQISPLSTLAVKADDIASGNFDHPLPEINRRDEIGVLNNSFHNMQTSLLRHIEELTTATAMRERMGRELQIARNIQMGMVPHDFPSRDDVDLFASMTPALAVGGDLYDFFIQNDKLYLCIGDVSGKGVPASLIMAVSRCMFRILARQDLSPAEIARGVNDTLAEENEQMLFVTMFFACIDLQSGSMEFCNCGHNAPVMLSHSGGAPHFLDCKPNTVIGIMPGFEYEGQHVDDIRDKVLFLYTDGLNEAENANHDQFGNDAMLEELGREPFHDAESLVKQMEAAVARHVDGADASDDLTMLCVRIKA